MGLTNLSPRPRSIVHSDIDGGRHEQDVPGHSAPTVGFEAPLEMLSACHGRIEDKCATLRRCRPTCPPMARTKRREPPQRDSCAISTCRRYSIMTTRRQDLFPALLESMAGSDPVCLRELTVSLSAEHRELEGRWRAFAQCSSASSKPRSDALGFGRGRGVRELVRPSHSSAKSRSSCRWPPGSSARRSSAVSAARCVSAAGFFRPISEVAGEGDR